ncbi:class I poly(R)-hydroxyalkanoic acid synthase [Alkalicaulis satelles]|uniref:Class I poly(R)-hydroxyalkanoic acid synthase n=1 Tax=Alkalicaulis satelles TaxID=2609175 RepID=A0A5M6ZCR7_9PROT|nr:class I poly(R)-hydroxyalkanoic acid synthase [Alkalicaulis satelles]KAA5801627.1 class I poly(R)-hydroxyalkanoic acid synthase [Alkalicaulis satelles]
MAEKKKPARRTSSGARARKPAAAKPESARPAPPPEAKAGDGVKNEPNPAQAAAAAASLGLVSDADIERLDTISRNLMQSALKSQKLMSDVMRRSLEGDPSLAPNADPLHAAPELMKAWESILSDPELLLQAQSDLYRGYLDLWAGTNKRLMSGGEAEPAIQPEQGDKRWRSKAWSEHPVFDAIKQSYLLNQRFMLNLLAGAKGLDEAAQRKVNFVTRQMMDAMAPTNFALTNPDVIEETIRTRGENLARGLTQLMSDLERGNGRLALSQTDMDGFEVGKDLAATPGAVIWRNEVMELIQYAPATETVRQRPLLIAPPWINKFYIMDMRPQGSMIRWLTEQGFTVFLISWINPDPRLKDASFEDYIRQGLFTALEVIETVTGERQVDTVGYCIGGTMLGTALALMAAEGDDRIASATFFAAQLDFKLAGELLVFIDQEWFAEIERLMDAQGGVLDGRTMADTFNMLRSNDLVWSFVINNYLLGRQPQAFDLLYWNADQTRMPKRLHLYYLDTFYRQNKLSEGRLEIAGHRLDLKNVTIPVFMQASKEDHIAPAGSVYRSAQKFGGPVQYMMAGSGHIAGVVNHPAANKYQHWINETLPDTREAWLEGAEERPGSWWPHWKAWLYAMNDAQVPAREPGGGKLEPICPAPGEYVKVRS